MVYEEIMDKYIEKLKISLKEIAPITEFGFINPILTEQIMIVPTEDRISRESIISHRHNVSIVIMCVQKTLKKDEEIEKIINFVGKVQDRVAEMPEFIIERIAFDYQESENAITRIGAVICSFQFSTKSE